MLDRRTARGVILDSDAAIWKVWLALLGRTAASHIVDAIGWRLAETTADYLNIGGQSLNSAATYSSNGRLRTQFAGADPYITRDGLRDSGPVSRPISTGALLTGSSFLTSAPEGDNGSFRSMRWTARDRGELTRFSSGDRGLSLGGQVTTGTHGADYPLAEGTGRNCRGAQRRHRNFGSWRIRGEEQVERIAIGRLSLFSVRCESTDFARGHAWRRAGQVGMEWRRNRTPQHRLCKRNPGRDRHSQSALAGGGIRRFRLGDIGGYLSDENELGRRRWTSVCWGRREPTSPYVAGFPNVYVEIRRRTCRDAGTGVAEGRW